MQKKKQRTKEEEDDDDRTLALKDKDTLFNTSHQYRPRSLSGWAAHRKEEKSETQV